METQNYQIITKANGKLFLIGEYAVLNNSEAILLGVNKYLYCEIKQSVNNQINSDYPFNNLYERESQHQKLEGFIEYFNQLYNVNHKYQINFISELHDGKLKLGLGSSAAVYVALAKALYQINNLVFDRCLIYKIVVSYLLKYQISDGSFADVASSYQEGMIYYRKFNFTKVKNMIQKYGSRVIFYDWPQLMIKEIKVKSSIKLEFINLNYKVSSNEAIKSFQQTEYLFRRKFTSYYRSLVRKIYHQLTKDDSSVILSLDKARKLMLRLVKKLKLKIKFPIRIKNCGSLNGDYLIKYSYDKKFNYQIKEGE